MIRQRVHLRTPLLAYVVRILTLVLALALLWYGLMVGLLAVKVSPQTVNDLSGDRTLYHRIAGLSATDFTTAVRLIAGAGGLLLFFVCLYLAAQELPRPYLARGDIALDKRAQGSTTVRPRAVERVAEYAARENRCVASAAGRLGDEELNVDIDVRRASVAADTLLDVQRRVATALDRHDLPDLPVNVTLAGYHPSTRRELA